MREGSIPVHDFPGDTGAPTVVAIHDLTGNGRWFGPLADELGGRVHLVAPDLRGRANAHGLAPATSLDTHVDDVTAVIDLIGRRCTLIGHGTGAVTAWMTAAARPGSIGTLVLLDGPAASTGSTGPDWISEAAQLDPGIERLRGTYEHRDRLVTMGIESGRLPHSGVSRALRPAVDAEVAGSGFGWRARLNATALERDWHQIGAWTPRSAPDVPIIALAARHGHRRDDPPLMLAEHPALPWRVVDTTHAGFLWDPAALGVVADIVTRCTPS